MTGTSPNILVFNVNWVGDVIFTTPIFRSLKQHYPASRVTCLAVPRVRGILECAPGIDEIMIFDEKGIHRGLWGKLQLIADLRRRHFDVVFLLHRSWTRALMVALAGVPERVGYATKKRGWLLTRRVPYPDNGVHRSDYYSHVVESAGVRIHDRSCALEADAHSRGEVRRVLESGGVTAGDRVVVIHVGGNWELKRWPPENFSLLIKGLATIPGVRIVIPGTAADHELARMVARDGGGPPLVLTGQTTLKQLVALMSLAELVISADSGPMHMADSVGTNVIALFGPTRPEVTGPRGKGKCVILQKDVACNREPCYDLTCPENKCMTAITVDDVMAAARGFLKDGGKHPLRDA